jgi:hypothetical protein
MKNLYKNEMLRYVSGCESGYVSVMELYMVYKDFGRYNLGKKNLDVKFIKKRVEKFCRKNGGVKVNEIEVLGGVMKVKGFYKF